MPSSAGNSNSSSKPAPDLETVELRHSQVLYQMGGRVQYAYFPFNALISNHEYPRDLQRKEFAHYGGT